MATVAIHPGDGYNPGIVRVNLHQGRSGIRLRHASQVVGIVAALGLAVGLVGVCPELWPDRPAAARSGNVRALVVGIGPAYPGPWALAGPEQDVGLAIEIARRMGCEPSQMEVLREAQATGAAIRGALVRLAAEPAGGGRVFVYFSGHGLRVPDSDGDEADGCDEALAPADALSLSGLRPGRVLLLDDEFGRLIRSLRAAEVIVMVDSCFSGTIDRDLGGPSVSGLKCVQLAGGCTGGASARWPSGGLELDLGLSRDASPAGAPRLAVLSAAEPSGPAYGDLDHGGRGSLLTRAVAGVLRERGTAASLRTLRDEAARRIEAECRRRGRPVQRPQLSGDPALLDGKLDAIGR